MNALIYVELDIRYCALTYGIAPCQASLTNSPPTGTIKCFNSPATCQDRENFLDQGILGSSPYNPTTLRFAVDTDYLPLDIECLPFIRDPGDIDITPAIVSLGQNLGQRATIRVRMRDARHSDTGTGGDKYLSERPYNPFEQGTFFGKLRARQPFLRGQNMRLIHGELGQTLEEMETRHFVVESFSGPSADGEYELIGKDVLKFADGDRAQAPRLSNGFLVADITAVAVTATLSPSGIGDTDYPASGYVAIGGKEVVSFTRSSDVLTIVRAQHNTEAQAHEAQDRVQLCLVYTGEDVADILYDLLVTYSDVPASYINLATWQSETANFLGTVYTALIGEPTAVDELCAELIEQAGLVVWWDDINRLIQLQVLRGIADVDSFTEDNTNEGTLKIADQPDKRISQVDVYFAKQNPLVKQDELTNYRSTASTDPDVAALADADYGTPAIKKVFSRWIPDLGRSIADRLIEVLLSRYRDPPRRFEFEVMRDALDAPQLGRGYRITSWALQDDTGASTNTPIQLTQINPSGATIKIEAEEMLFAASDTDVNNRQVVVDSNILNVNLRTSHDNIYPEPVGGETVTCTINAGVIVGSSTVALPAFDVGSWPVGVTLVMFVVGRIQGRGGRGGDLSSPAGAGQAGGTALFTRYAITVTATDGEIWGGGGGGALFGGGGAGQLPGAGGVRASDNLRGDDGTTEAGGAGANAGANGGAGGGPGLAGANFSGAAGGAAGNAIDGDSFVALTGGDIRGPQIN